MFLAGYPTSVIIQFQIFPNSHSKFTSFAEKFQNLALIDSCGQRVTCSCQIWWESTNRKWV